MIFCIGVGGGGSGGGGANLSSDSMFGGILVTETPVPVGVNKDHCVAMAAKNIDILTYRHFDISTF